MDSPSTRAPTLHWLMLASGTVTFLLMLAVSLLPVNALPLLAAVISLLTAQLTVIAMVLFLSVEPLRARMWNAGVYACWTYAAAFVPPALAADRFGFQALTTAQLGGGLLAAYAFALALFEWASAVRLSATSTSDALQPPVARPLQFPLRDLMWWVTLICVALGVWSFVTNRFLTPQPLIDWRSEYYQHQLPDKNLVGGFTFVFGGPVMLAEMGVFWITLSHTTDRKNWLLNLAILWLLLTIVPLAFGAGVEGPLTIGCGPALFLLPGLLHALVMRWLGWRLVPARDTLVSRRL